MGMRSHDDNDAYAARVRMHLSGIREMRTSALRCARPKRRTGAMDGHCTVRAKCTSMTKAPRQNAWSVEVSEGTSGLRRARTGIYGRSPL
jgi:hypothetical protein